MKKLLYLLLPALLAVFVVSCSDENQEARTPVASIKFDVSSTHLAVNQSMEIWFTGTADLVSVYTGDADHRYEMRDSSETGVVVNKGYFTYSYSSPGVFHVVCVASTFDTYKGNNLKQDTCSFYVTVTDDVTKLDNIYSTITPNTYYATQLGENDWQLCLPAKQVYNNREITLNPARQRLYTEIASDSSMVFIDLSGEDKELLRNYSSLTAAQQKELKAKVNSTKLRYDLSKTHVLTVRSYLGTVVDYHLYCLIYPEFKTVSVNGVKGTLSRDAFDQSAQTYTFVLPQGTDLTQAKVEFTTNEKADFMVGGTALTSGSVADISSGTFTMVNTSPENASAKAVSKVRFVFNYQ